jgi:diadenosine tetraphosphate (Ap4A) HIT family hydrolase
MKDLHIKTYDNWDLLLNEKQSYLGRSVATALRADAVDMNDMTTDERDELFDKVYKDWDEAVSNLFQYDVPNVSCLANDYRHLHWHFVPRYETPRNFEGVQFVDERFGHNYSPTPKKEVPDEVITKLREAIKAEIE